MGFSLRYSAVLISALLLFLSSPGDAVGSKAPLKSIAQLTIDDDGRKLSYPAAVFFDPGEEEIYLVNGGTGRVVVYGPDFFPRVSIGVGRGIGAPQGGAVMPNGEVYICQVRNAKNPTPRITILNGAFFVDREIFLDQIPEAAGFAPKQLAVNRDGVIYLAGNNSRGVLVLDNEGTFLRRLQPMDVVRNPQTIEEEAKQSEEQTEDTLSGDAEEMALEEDMPFADIPEEFRPRKSGRDTSSGPSEGLGPVRINYVTIDSAGNLYLVSAETSKIYVYGPDESFQFSFGQKGGSPGQMSQPRALAIDEKRGLIHVVDYMRHSILVYDMAGQYLFEFGGQGTGPGWFNFPSGIAVDNYGHVIVTDLFNRRAQVLYVEYQEFFPMFRGKSPDPSDASPPEESGLDDEIPTDADTDFSAAGRPEISLEGDISETPAAAETENVSPDTELSEDSETEASQQTEEDKTKAVAY